MMRNGSIENHEGPGRYPIVPESEIERVAREFVSGTELAAALGAESGMGADWPGGFLCPCHGSLFDLAGRVYSSMPAPDNLEIPPHKYVADTKIVIGEDGKA